MHTQKGTLNQSTYYNFYDYSEAPRLPEALALVYFCPSSHAPFGSYDLWQKTLSTRPAAARVCSPDPISFFPEFERFHNLFFSILKINALL